MASPALATERAMSSVSAVLRYVEKKRRSVGSSSFVPSVASAAAARFTSSSVSAGSRRCEARRGAPLGSFIAASASAIGPTGGLARMSRKKS